MKNLSSRTEKIFFYQMKNMMIITFAASAIRKGLAEKSCNDLRYLNNSGYIRAPLGIYWDSKGF